MDIIELLYTSLHFIILAYARYSLFREQLRIPMRWLLPLVAALTALGCFVWYTILRELMLPLTTYRFLFALLMFGLSCLLIQAPFSKHALSYITIYAYNIFIEAVATFIAGLFPDTTVPALNMLLMSLLLLFTIWPVMKLVRWITAILSSMGSEKVWNYLCACGFSILFIALLSLYPFGNEMVLRLLTGMVMLSAVLSMYGAAIQIQISLKKGAETAAALELANRQVAMQQDYYDHLVSQMEEIRHIRHDLRHHRAALMSMIKSGDTQTATEYVKSWDVLDSSMPVTGNLAADSIVSYYYNKARDLGFTLETELSLPQMPPISEPDLCVLLGNLLENAIDAQSYLSPERRYVRICAKADARSLTLAVDNRFDGTVKRSGERFLTRKDDKDHGIGLSSVRAICKKYNGVLQLEPQGDMFLAGIVIGL